MCPIAAICACAMLAMLAQMADDDLLRLVCAGVKSVPVLRGASASRTCSNTAATPRCANASGVSEVLSSATLHWGSMKLTADAEVEAPCMISCTSEPMSGALLMSSIRERAVCSCGSCSRRLTAGEHSSATRLASHSGGGVRAAWARTRAPTIWLASPPYTGTAMKCERPYLACRSAQSGGRGVDVPACISRGHAVLPRWDRSSCCILVLVSLV
mmetsp:Transcript_2098/g.4752  ORF Transcript_2098/g.4752 Transcript_2098/m.4752 type:complete len:214 (-) Transcript_2098:250-891(-)